jgi:tripartite-type tricarboxylate transporter receptor subunit TctC
MRQHGPPGRRALIGLGAAAAAAGLPLPALGQGGGGAGAAAFPSRPVTLVVPFPPGGSTDCMARLLAERMAPLLGQPVLVENRGGAATAVGAEAVARAAPDGHTVLVNSGSTLTILPLVMRRLPYQVEDFAPVGLLAVLPVCFLAQNTLPATVPDFVAFARANPGRINYGTNGPSSFNNIAAVLISEAFGIRMQDVTYRGDGQQLAAFLAGTLDLAVVGGSAAIGTHRNGQGRIVAWTGDRRLPALPEVPTFSEWSPNTVAQTYFGLVVPARTPPGPIERLSAAAQQALREPALRERLLAEGQFAEGTTPEAYAAFLAREAERWRPVLAKLNLQLD